MISQSSDYVNRIIEKGDIVKDFSLNSFNYTFRNEKKY